MKALIAALLATAACLCLPPSAHAQNVTCATRPQGDSTNACASTAFVQQALSGVQVSPPLCVVSGNLTVCPNPQFGVSVTVANPGGSSTLALENGGPNYANVIAGYTGSITPSLRWGVFLGDSAPEGPGNVGSNFAINAYSNTGGYIGQPFNINRSNGEVVLGSGFPNAIMALNHALGPGASALQGWTNGILRWQLQFGNAAADSGGNVGSDFGVYSYNDFGAYLGNPFSINRATGIGSFSNGLQAPTWSCADNSGNAATTAYVHNCSNGFYTNPKFAGAVNIPIANRLSVFATGADTGVRCDGSTDDWYALQTLINGVSNQYFGGMIVLPNGLCVLSNTLTLPSHVYLVGQGRDNTVLYNTAGDGATMIYIANASYVAVRDIQLQHSTFQTVGQTIYVANSSHVLLDNFETYGSSWGVAWEGGASQDIGYIHNFYMLTRNGILVGNDNSGVVGDLDIDHGRIIAGGGYTGGWGIWLDNTNAIRVTNVNATGFSTGIGIGLYPSAGHNTQYTFLENDILTFNSEGMLIQPSVGTGIYYVKLTNVIAGASAGNGFQINCNVASSLCGAFQFDSPLMWRNQGHGMFVDSTQSMSISNGMACNNGYTHPNTASGLWINNNTNHVMVTGGQYGGCDPNGPSEQPEYGITIGVGACFIMLLGIDLSTNITGPYQNASACGNVSIAYVW